MTSELVYDPDVAVVVTVALVRVVQVTVDQIVDVVAVRNGFMAAIRSVGVCGIVAVAGMSVGAVGRVGRAHRKGVFVDMAVMRMMQVSAMQEVRVSVVLNGRVPAVVAMLVGVVLVDDVIVIHGVPFA